MQFKRLRLYTSTPFQYNDQNSLGNPTFDTWGSFNDSAFRRAAFGCRSSLGQAWLAMFHDSESGKSSKQLPVYYSNKYDHGVKLFLPNVVTCSNPKHSNTAFLNFGVTSP
jgi:hypothetical protein